MSQAADKRIGQLREGLEINLKLDFMDDDEIGHIIAEISSFDPVLRQKILALSLSLSHASSSFVVSTLARIKKARRILSLKSTEKWVTNAFDLLDSKGIDPFIKFISEADDAEALRIYQDQGGLRLQSVLPRLEAYIQGISGLGSEDSCGEDGAFRYSCNLSSGSYKLLCYS